MELERIFTLSSKDDYESLAYDTLYDIYAQQQRVHPIEIDCDVTFFSLKDMHKNFSEMSDDDKCVTIKKMSTQLLLLSCVATCLPQELVQNICLLMMDGEITSDITQEEQNKIKSSINKAADEFYTTPVGKAFDQYHPIQIWLAHTKLPIGPVYVASSDKRNVMLEVKSEWYSSVPVISYERKKSVDTLDYDLKHIYLQGKEVVVMPNDYTRDRLCIGATVLLAGPCVCSLCIGGGAAVGAVCYGNPGCVLTKPFCLTAGIGSGFFSLFSWTYYLCTGLADVTNLKRMTI